MMFRNGSSGSSFDWQYSTPVFFFTLQVSSLPSRPFFMIMLGGGSPEWAEEFVHLTNSLRGFGTDFGPG